MIDSKVSASAAGGAIATKPLTGFRICISLYSRPLIRLLTMEVSNVVV